MLSRRRTGWTGDEGASYARWTEPQATTISGRTATKYSPILNAIDYAALLDGGPAHDKRKAEIVR